MSRAVLLFPPNWATAVSGPHLALPLLAGVARAAGWQVESWDLTKRFARAVSTTPNMHAIAAAAGIGDFDALDRMYFRWEDQVRAAKSTSESGQFGLLSGYPLHSYADLPLARVRAQVARQGTPYTAFLNKQVDRLCALKPDVIAVTIASHHQVVPAVELLQLLRYSLPDSFIVLGGNVVTRLRDTTAFSELCSLADQTVVFQGELAFRRTLEIVADMGPVRARAIVPRVAGDQRIHPTAWPQPRFDGLLDVTSGAAPVLPYVSTRGCYWGRCHFCAIPAGWAISGYAGSAPAELTARHILAIAAETGVTRFKFVDESFPPAKARSLARLLAASGVPIEWETYARLEPAWEDAELLSESYVGGLRKLYFGLEQAPTTDRRHLNKHDRGDAQRILGRCAAIGIKVHLFCMVGHPRSTLADAEATTRFLIDHQETIDTADLVGFRLDRATAVPGVVAVDGTSDWATSLAFAPTEKGVLDQEAIAALEEQCQETLWDRVPRMLHPLYRLVGPWAANRVWVRSGAESTAPRSRGADLPGSSGAPSVTARHGIVPPPRSNPRDSKAPHSRPDALPTPEDHPHAGSSDR